MIRVVDNAGATVRLNDPKRTLLEFDNADLLTAQRISAELNDYEPKSARFPFDLVIDQAPFVRSES